MTNWENCLSDANIEYCVGFSKETSDPSSSSGNQGQKLSTLLGKKTHEEKFSMIKDLKGDPIEERSKLQSRFGWNAPIEDDPDGQILRSGGRHNEIRNRGQGSFILLYASPHPFSSSLFSNLCVYLDFTKCKFQLPKPIAKIFYVQNYRETETPPKKNIWRKLVRRKPREKLRDMWCEQYIGDSANGRWWFSFFTFSFPSLIIILKTKLIKQTSLIWNFGGVIKLGRIKSGNLKIFSPLLLVFE